MPVDDITADMKGRYKSGRYQANQKETAEVNFIQVFGIQKQIRYSQVFAETACDHSEQDHPTKDENHIPFQIVQQELYRKREEYLE
jgi:hypothetical protein